MKYFIAFRMLVHCLLYVMVVYMLTGVLNASPREISLIYVNDGIFLMWELDKNYFNQTIYLERENVSHGTKILLTQEGLKPVSHLRHVKKIVGAQLFAKLLKNTSTKTRHTAVYNIKSSSNKAMSKRERKKFIWNLIKKYDPSMVLLSLGIPVFGEVMRNQWFDEDVQSNQKYRYTVYTQDPLQGKVILHSSEIYIRNPIVLKYPSNIQTKARKNKFSFSWKTSVKNASNSRFIIGYNAYYRFEPSQSWQKKNLYPIMSFNNDHVEKNKKGHVFRYHDTCDQEGVHYIYAFSYIYVGGFEGSLSQPVKVLCKRTSNRVSLKSITGVSLVQTSRGEVQIIWNRLKHTQFYQVYRSLKYSNRGDLINPIPVSHETPYFTDTLQHKHTGHTLWYTIQAYNSRGVQLGESIQLSCIIKKANQEQSIQILQNKVKEKFVFLSWKTSISKRYQKQFIIYRRNGFDGKFYVYGRTKKMFFYDSDIQYGKTYFYKIALENHSEDISSVSSITEIQAIWNRAISLVAPYNIEATVQYNTVTMTWNIRTSSKINGFWVYKKNHSNRWVKLYQKPLSSTTRKFIDTLSVGTASAIYTIQSVGSDGRVSSLSDTVTAKVKSTRLPTISNFMVTEVSCQIQLSWNWVSQFDITRFHVYRRFDNQSQFSLYKTINSNKRSFVDVQVSKNKRYDYVIYVVDRYNQEGIPSDMQSVRVSSRMKC